MDTNSPSTSSVVPGPVWEESPTVEVGNTWLSSSDEDRSIARDIRVVVYDELWAYRGLLYELARRDLRVRYKQTVLGIAWAVLLPSLIVLAGATVRYAMAYVAGRQLSAEELAGIAVKAVPWSFFVGSMSFATASLVGQAQLVTKIYFPREVLPLAAVLAQAFDACLGGISLLIAFSLLGVHFGLAVLWVPVVVACTFLLTAGLALLVSCANLFYRDVKYVVQVLLMFGIFFTPVFFEPAMFGALGARLMMANPLAPLLEGLRLSVAMDHNLLDTLVVQGRHGSVLAWSPWYLAYSAGCAIAASLAGLVLFHRAESNFAEYV